MKIEEAAKRFFGITTDINKAGFILADGTMLDLSGNHLKDTDSNKRMLMHFSFFGINKYGFSLESLFEYYRFFYKKYPLLQFMHHANAMRCRCNNIYMYAEYTKVPTKEQLQIVKQVFDAQHKKSFTLELVNLSGYIIDSIEYTQSFSIEEVLGWSSIAIKKEPSKVLVESSINLYAKHCKENY